MIVNYRVRVNIIQHNVVLYDSICDLTHRNVKKFHKQKTDNNFYHVILLKAISIKNKTVTQQLLKEI